MSKQFAVAVALHVATWHAISADEPQRTLREIRSFTVAEAHQAVAVDAAHFYAITNRAIGKYDKTTGQRVARWQAPDDSPLRHLNSGVVIDGKLYCAHSNWPAEPLQNSIEIWDAETLKHLDSRRFADSTGAITWVDRRDGKWWVVFARYGGAEQVRDTTLMQMNDCWQRQASWTFPDEVIQRFVPFSNSGGSWGPDQLLYVTGHDRAEMYAMRLPARGSTLELVEVVPLKIAGQGIAWDRHDIGAVWGIRRKTQEVVASRLAAVKQSGKSQP